MASVIGARLDDVALKYEIADVELDGDAVAHGARRTCEGFDAADRLRRGRRAGLPVLRVLARRTRACKNLDQARGQERALRRSKVGLLLVPEIVGDEDLAAVLSGQDEVGPFAVEIGGEQEVRVGDGHDGAIRLNGYRRCAVAHVERLTPRVKHDLTLSGRSPKPNPGAVFPQTPIRCRRAKPRGSAAPRRRVLLRYANSP